MTVNEKIRMLRKKRRLSQQQLAEMVGVHITHLSRIENGHNVPSLDVFRRLVDVFGVASDYLLYDDARQGDDDINDRPLYERVRLIDKLGEKDRLVLIHIIDTMLLSQRMRELLIERGSA